MNENQSHATPPLRDADALVSVMSKVHRLLAVDLRERALDPRIEPSIRAAHASDVAAKRTGEGYEGYREGFCDQVAASWVLCAVFARTLEDRGYLPHRLAGPGAADRFAQFLAQFKFLRERDYLLHIFDSISLLPGGAEVFGPAHAPLWRLGPSSRALSELLDALKATEGENLRFTFGRPTEAAAGAEPKNAAEHDGASTRYLGDLYQDLNEGVRKRYALLQTPEFVERFILELTLDPAIRERGIAVTVIDPACGSGHFLIGAYDRLFEARRQAEPGKPVEESARTALAQIHGIDLNPYAAAIARFRLLLSYLDKSGIQRLDKVPTGLALRVYVGDALLAGAREEQITFGDDLARRGEAPQAAGYERGALCSFFDEATDQLLQSTRFDVVVANPPYITEKDPTKREEIRARYKAATGLFSLAAPFAERIFQLANDGGFTGQITANSFMKREFGKGLIQGVLSGVDLTEVLDTSGAFIPGHGTPTVLLFGRGRAPIQSIVRVAMGNRGEPTTPEVPAEGKVWSSIASNHKEVGYEDEFISIADIKRDKLAQHPWSLGGGGATELKALLEERAVKRLGEVADSIGFGCITKQDEVFCQTIDVMRRLRIEDPICRPFGIGEDIRDYGATPGLAVVFPYDSEIQTLRLADFSNAHRFMWPFRESLLCRREFSGATYREAGRTWYEFGQIPADKYRTPLSITFAFVATHNHFVLDRGGKVFNRTAPIIKLPEGATEEEHLALLGYLNSSTVGFLVRQFCQNRGYGAGSDNARVTAESWSDFYEIGSGLLAKFPVPETSSLLDISRLLDQLGRARSVLENDWLAQGDLNRETVLSLASAARQNHVQLTRRMVALQEELDWRVYALFGLGAECFPGAEADERYAFDAAARAMELRLGSQLAKGDVTSSWFERQARARVDIETLVAPPGYVDLLRRRLKLIEGSRTLQLLEAPEHKRCWEPFDWDGAIRKGCESSLLDRTEAALHQSADPRPTSVRALAHLLHSDPKARAVAEALTNTTTFDLEALLGDLLERDSVASSTSERYTDIGIEKRRAWEQTWDLQRLEDAGEHPTIPKPEKYAQADFENAGVVWRLRGKLDVPKERFIAYPTATPPSGASGKAGLVFGWAGWTHLEQLQAAIELWQEELGHHGHELIPQATRKEREESLGASASNDEGLANDRAARKRLMPILQTMVDLLPWMRQWHDEDGETASSFEAYVDAEARKLEVTREETHLYRRPKKVAGPKKKAAPKKSATEKAAPTDKKTRKTAPTP